MNKGDANLQTLLHTCKDFDVVFAVEPPVHRHTRNGTFHYSGLKNLRPGSKVEGKTKLVAYIARRQMARIKITQNRPGTCILIKIVNTHVCGVYLPRKDSQEKTASKTSRRT